MLTIKILGNGGAINAGLPYNAFVINENVLCEAPPDIMLSLHHNGINLSSLKTVFVSHLHGDHTFGLPFLILSAWFIHARDHKELAITIIGPRGIQDLIEGLAISAFTADHPCLKWMQASCSFVQVDESSQPVLLPGWETRLFRLDHAVETYGFSLTNPDDGAAFAYIADTLWCEAVQTVLSRSPNVVLVDLNGQDDDPMPVHLSIHDIRAKALPITGTKTQYYGTHLKKEFSPVGTHIQCARPGMVITFDYENQP